MQDKQAIVAKWSPRVGERAAQLSVSSARLVGLGGLLVPVWAVLFVLGHNKVAIVALASVLAAVDIVLLFRGVTLMSRMYCDMSNRFGTKVWFLNSPSLRDGQFESWCQRHGVEPGTGRPSGQIRS